MPGIQVHGADIEQEVPQFLGVCPGDSGEWVGDSDNDWSLTDNTFIGFLRFVEFVGLLQFGLLTL